MQINLLSSESDMSIDIKGQIDKDRLLQFSDMLDHALLNKDEVEYRREENCLNINLERNEYEKKKKKFLWFNIWLAGKYPTRKCVLTIRDVEDCDIRDGNPDDKQVLIGGISCGENKVYIGSFCEQENTYGISLKVRKINITLQDI